MQNQSIIQRGYANYFYFQKMRVANVASRVRYMRELCLHKNALHVGCTDFPVFNPESNLHIQLKDYCQQLDGLDTDIEGMRKLSEYVQGRFYSDVKDIKGTYDIVLVPETIEHVPNIQEFLSSLDSVRFSNIFFTAPCLIGWSHCFNYRDVKGRAHQLLAEADEYIEEIHPDHKAWFTQYTLANCIEQYTNWRINSVMFLEGKRMVGIHCTKEGRF